MKIGDNVTRKWKPALGEGKIIHLLGDRVVVQWTSNGLPKLQFELKKYLRVVDEDR